jgi:hypothetical protein
MTIDLDSRRPIRKILGADFAGFPVWEWALHEQETLGQGESFVRPTALDAIPLGQPRQFVVGASITLSDGTVLPGCVELDVRLRKVKAAPMFIFLQERQLVLGAEQTRSTLAHYTKVADVRPVSWTLAVPVEGQPGAASGKIRRSLRSRLASLFARTPSASAWVRV